MARKIVLRGDVPGDLHAIVAYLEQHSIAAADRFAEAVFDALDGLAEMPGKGSLKQFRSRKLDGIRSWAVPGFRKYLILYRTAPEAIEVLAVTHGSRRLRKLLLNRMPR
jgi:toxin ParE1/3/4